MNLGEIAGWSGGGLLLLLTFIQIAPIKVNPWSAIVRGIGKALNGDVLKKLDVLEEGQLETRKRLDKHIRIDDDRNADTHRSRILHFNTELLRGNKHTREDFIEVLAEIDFYEHYCREHPDYENNRAVLAIENIERVYKDLMENDGFL